MRINRQQLGTMVSKVGQPITQLRELTVAHRSGVAVNENEDDSALTAKPVKTNSLARDGAQLKIWRRHAYPGAVDL